MSNAESVESLNIQPESGSCTTIEHRTDIPSMEAALTSSGGCFCRQYHDVLTTIYVGNAVAMDGAVRGPATG
jgi:hypothetical protein